VQSAARKPGEGTRFPRDFHRGVHRRLLKSVGAYRTVSWIVETPRRDVNHMLRRSPRQNEKPDANRVRHDRNVGCCDYGFSGLPCSDLLDRGAFSRDPLECCAGARSTCGLPRASPCGPLAEELFGTDRTSLACRELLAGAEFGRKRSLSRFTAFVGRSFRPKPLLASEAFPAGRSPR